MGRCASARRLLPAVSAGILAFCSPSAAQRLEPSPANSARGTYQLSICGGTCTDSSAAVRGYLVLDDRPLPLTSVPRSALEYFSDRTILLMGYEGMGEALNACFVLSRNESFRGYAGLTPVGLTRWSMQEGDSVATLLHQSPDAGYLSRFVIRDGGLSGRGWSWGIGDAAVSLPENVVRGQRIGPPDFALCYAAAEKDARKPLHDPGSPFP